MNTTTTVHFSTDAEIPSTWDLTDCRFKDDAKKIVAWHPFVSVALKSESGDKVSFYFETAAQCEAAIKVLQKAKNMLRKVGN